MEFGVFKVLLLYLFSLTLFRTSSAKLYTSPAQLNITEYDFIIVGCGAAGSVLANRLTENPEFAVLVIEAGVTNVGVLSTIVPFLAPTAAPNTSVTWNYTTVPQIGLDNRVLLYPRGKVLGGSSSINRLAYNRASDDDWNRYANITGDSGWSAESIIPYYLKNSRLVPPADNHNTTGQVNPAIHGTGPIEVSLNGFPMEIDGMVANASRVLGGQFKFNEDIQSGDTIGIGYYQSTVGQSRRSSGATAYVEPVLDRPNLHVLIQTQVLKLFQTNLLDNQPVFGKVEVAQDSNSENFVFAARKEIILSAGSIGTPQILMLSGIGNKTTLNNLGIESIVDLPDVGQHLQDHPLTANSFLVNSNNTFDPILRNSTLAAEALQEWNTTGQGIYVDSRSSMIGFIRLPNNSTILETFGDPSAGPGSGHMEFLFSNGFSGNAPPPGSFLSLTTVVVSPISRGSVTLASKDPFTFPLIDPRFLTEDFDVQTAIEAIKFAFSFLSAPVWNGYIIGPYGALANVTTDAEIEAYVKASASTIFHPIGTARMAPVNASWGAVDSSLLLKGAVGVRIVDASIFPVIPAVHTVAPVYIVAERAADLIKAAHAK